MPPRPFYTKLGLQNCRDIFKYDTLYQLIIIGYVIKLKRFTIVLFRNVFAHYCSQYLNYKESSSSNDLSVADWPINLLDFWITGIILLERKFSSLETWGAAPWQKPHCRFWINFLIFPNYKTFNMIEAFSVKFLKCNFPNSLGM